MDELKKLTEEELNELMGINNKKREIDERILAIGTSELNISLAKKQLESDVVKISQDERTYTDKITGKYGNIRITNLETGEFEVMQGAPEAP